jgi:glycerol-3-phosphate acyltransferase PlsY
MAFLSPILVPALLAAGSYLLGSIPSGLVVSRLLKGRDPRGVGSGNIGATNVLRASGAGAAALTLAGDVLKGVVPALAGAGTGTAEGPPLAALAGACAILGHDFPLFLRFRGGKGVATTVGALLAFDPVLAAILAGVWLSIVAVTRISSAGALAGALSCLPVCLLLGRKGVGLWFPAAAALLLVLRHHRNIRRLLAGSESRIGKDGKRGCAGRGSETGQ